VRANDPNDVLLGGANGANATTSIDNNVDNGIAVFEAGGISGRGLFGHCTSGIGVLGTSSSFFGVRGSSSSSYGVSGISSSSYGVYGSSTSGTGVGGSSDSLTGVRGDSGSGFGVWGDSDSGFGVYGTSTSSYGVHGTSSSRYGVIGTSSASDRPAILGRSNGNSTGILGSSGGTPAAKAKTGVYGYAAQDSTSKGLYGESPAGYAGYFAGKVYTTKWYELTEVNPPAAPGTNRARLFLRDNGNGKTQLCVRFHTETVKVLAVQP
jgi:hypothetical protein